MFCQVPLFITGARLGLMMAKMILCNLIHNYTFTRVAKEIKFKPGNAILGDQNGIHMTIKKRNK